MLAQKNVSFSYPKLLHSYFALSSRDGPFLPCYSKDPIYSPFIHPFLSDFISLHSWSFTPVGLLAGVVDLLVRVNIGRASSHRVSYHSNQDSFGIGCKDFHSVADNRKDKDATSAVVSLVDLS